MQLVDGFYENYFRSLILNDVTLTGDITPSYGLLRAAHFKEIKQRLENAGFAVRVVFLMRDPVERCWSAARMGFRDAEAKGTTLSHAQKIREFVEFYGVRMNAERTRYDRTVHALTRAFHKKDVHFGIYEEMFDQAEIQRLSEFLGVSANVEMRDTRFNESPAAELPESIVNECRNFFSGVYEFCFDRFPQTRLLWNSPPHR